MHGKERYQRLRSFETLLLIKPRPLLRNSIYTRRSVAIDYCLEIWLRTHLRMFQRWPVFIDVVLQLSWLFLIWICDIVPSTHVKLRILSTFWYSNLLITAFINSTLENGHDLFCNLNAMSVLRNMTTVFDHERMKRIWYYLYLIVASKK